MSRGPQRYRVLIADDNAAIHRDIKKVLEPLTVHQEMALAEQELFGEPLPEATQTYAITSTFQGLEAIAAIKDSLAQDTPFAVAIIDMRMPPGLDGLQTIQRILAVDDDVHIIICSAYSDYSWKTLSERLSANDRVLILKKPFDIIELSQMVNALSKKWHLQRETRARMRDLEAARELAEQAVAAQRQFLANMSHELRTPMNSVLGMLELVLSTCSEGRIRQDLETAQRSAWELLRLLNDVLDYSKFRSGHFHIESAPFSPRQVVEDVCAVLQGKATSKKLSLRLRIDTPLSAQVLGDALRLKQVLHNLLDNAVKFTHTGSVEVFLRQDGERLFFTVRDTGIGIQPDHLEEIFLPFHQEDASTTRQFGGTGLGLTISRELVQQMGGELSVESIPGTGTTFRFSILARSSNVSLPTVSRPALDMLQDSTCRILVVEDHPVNQTIIRRLLSLLGYTCDVVSDGQQAIDRVTRQPYDVIFMDCQMPVMDGYESTRRIRRTNLPWQPWIVALTASALPEEREKGIEAGMDLYLAKPINLETLQAALGGCTAS